MKSKIEKIEIPKGRTKIGLRDSDGKMLDVTGIAEKVNEIIDRLNSQEEQKISIKEPEIYIGDPIPPIITTGNN